MTKHSLTLPLWKLCSSLGRSDSDKRHPGENVVIMSATKETEQLGQWCHFMPGQPADVELFGRFLLYERQSKQLILPKTGREPLRLSLILSFRSPLLLQLLYQVYVSEKT